MGIEKPIFFIGMPRSGTTIIFEAFAAHRDIGWFSNYSNRFPWFPYITFIHRIFLGTQGRKNQDKKLALFKRVLPEPQEVYNIWERFFGMKFTKTSTKNCVPTEHVIKASRSFVKKMLWAESKHRFCAKFTGPPRINFLSHVFPDAYFVDVVRDPRAVISSLLSVAFWKKDGLKKPFWEGVLSKNELNIWEKMNRSPVALAALQWCAVYDATIEEISCARNPYYKVKYEEFMMSPIEMINRVVSFCDLKICEEMQCYIHSQKYRNMNHKFKEKLTDENIKIIEEITRPYMEKLGYLEK